MKTLLTTAWAGILATLLHPFSWTPWVDLKTFSYGGDAYLLQGRKNTISNAKRFRVQPTKNAFQTANVGQLSMDELITAGLAQTTLNDEQN